MNKLTEAVLEFLNIMNDNNFHKLLEIIDEMYQNDEIIPVPAYYFGKEKGFTFEEIRTMNGDIVLLSMLSEPEFYEDRGNNSQLLGMSIRMFFANYFSSDRFAGIVINPNTDMELPLPNSEIIKLKLYKDFEKQTK